MNTNLVGIFCAQRQMDVTPNPKYNATRPAKDCRHTVRCGEDKMAFSIFKSSCDQHERPENIFTSNRPLSLPPPPPVDARKSINFEKNKIVRN